MYTQFRKEIRARRRQESQETSSMNAAIKSKRCARTTEVLTDGDDLSLWPPPKTGPVEEQRRRSSTGVTLFPASGHIRSAPRVPIERIPTPEVTMTQAIAGMASDNAPS